MCEYLDIYIGADAPWLFTSEPAPKDGGLELRAAPSFEYEVDEAALENSAGVAPVW